MRDVAAFKREGLAMVPVDTAARMMIGKLKDGERFFAEIWKPRNMRQHRAYFAMLNNVVQASGQWPSLARLELDIAIALKAGDWWESREGLRTFIPHSRAVASMPRDEFEQLHSDTVALLTDWLGCDPESLRDEPA